MSFEPGRFRQSGQKIRRYRSLIPKSYAMPAADVPFVHKLRGTVDDVTVVSRRRAVRNRLWSERHQSASVPLYIMSLSGNLTDRENGPKRLSSVTAFSPTVIGSAPRAKKSSNSIADSPDPVSRWAQEMAILPRS